MDKPYCSDCKRVTEVVFDQSAGDTVCMDCGLVLEAHSVDESSEWRTFSGEQSGADPNRVGEASNPLLGNKVALTTIITKGNASNTDVALLGRWQNRGSNSDRNLLTAFATIATMADRLGLVSTIKDRASEIYKKVEDIKSIRGRSQDSMVAACLYIACRQEDKPRTFKEICCVANGATKREIGRATKFIVKQLEEEMGIAMDMGTIHAADLLRRFCSHLGMNNQATRAAIETVKSIEALDIRAKLTMFLGPTLIPTLDPTLVSVLDPTLVPAPRIAQKRKASWRLWYWWLVVDKSGTWVLFVITPSSYQKHKASWRLWYWWLVGDKSGTWVLFVIAPSRY